jgi:hypothetical protein
VPAAPFENPDAFHRAFSLGLERLLDESPGLGAYILAFNNAAFDPRIRDTLAVPLERGFERFARLFRDSLRRGVDPALPPDDIAVFLRMLAVGYQDLKPARSRREGPWEVQFNRVRGFRPARAAGGPPPALHTPFDPKGFHFNKPFLRPETFWSGTFAGRSLDLLYNKFPFVECQTIVVPDREDESPQFLARRDHELAWTLSQTLGSADAADAVAVGYNSLGAFASVNHLHFHLTLRASPLPILDRRWQHQGGPDAYPIGCQVVREPEAGWDLIDTLQDSGQAFNLIYTPGQLHCIARRPQGDYELPDWCSGHSWYEFAGGMLCFDEARYLGLTAEDIRSAIALGTPPP